jgi:hypothetical protein
LKAAREKQMITYKGLLVDCSGESLQTRGDIFKVEEEGRRERMREGERKEHFLKRGEDFPRQT